MMKKLELKIIPPIVALIALIGMWLTHLLLGDSGFSLSIRLGFILFIIIGVVVALLGVAQFKKSQTTLTPRDPEKASSLVTTGVYKYTRNPMYLGISCVLLGLAGLFGQLILIGWVGFFVVYLTQFQIKPEERILLSKFPNEFEAYKKTVRRWV